MKKIASLLTAIALTAAAAGCAAPQETTAETSDTTAEATTTTTETTYIIDSDPVDDTPETEYVEMPVFEPMDIDFETADRGRIIPCVGGFVEDKWVKENDVAYFSFVTLDGEVLCSAIFNFAYYAEDAKTYIVRRTEYGVSKYGFLSDDGAVFTGLIYDGAAVAQGSKADGVCFYGTNYADGYLWVSSLDKDLNVIDTSRVTIDEEEISLVAETAQLSVIYIDETSTVMINRNQFYYKTMIIDNASGRLLHDDSSSGFRDPHIFGKIYIELEYTGAGLAVYDIRGNQLLDDKEAYAGFITDDLFMISRNNEISIYDTDIDNFLLHVNLAITEFVFIVRSSFTIIMKRSKLTFFNDWFSSFFIEFIKIIKTNRSSDFNELGSSLLIHFWVREHSHLWFWFRLWLRSEFISVECIFFRDELMFIFFKLVES